MTLRTHLILPNSVHSPGELPYVDTSSRTRAGVLLAMTVDSELNCFVPHFGSTRNVLTVHTVSTI